MSTVGLSNFYLDDGDYQAVREGKLCFARLLPLLASEDDRAGLAGPWVNQGLRTPFPHCLRTIGIQFVEVFLCYHVFVPLHVVGQTNVVKASVPVGVAFVPWPFTVRTNKDDGTDMVFRAIAQVCFKLRVIWVDVRRVAPIPVRPGSLTCEGRFANFVDLGAHERKTLVRFALGSCHAIYRVAVDRKEGTAGSFRLLGVVN